MALAEIAYAEPEAIAGLMASYPLLQAFAAVWMPDPAEMPENFAFVARKDDDVVVAIRGTYPVPWNLAYWEDGHQSSPFSPFTPWPFAANGACVTQGLLTGFRVLHDLPGAGTTLGAFLRTLPPHVRVTVVGHSLGGSLAPLLGHWLSTVRVGPIAVATFAGMTPGNQAFADLFSASTVPAWRYWNTLDTVGYGWNNVLGTQDFYQPAPQGGVLVRDMLRLTAARIDQAFVPVGVSMPLTGSVLCPQSGYFRQMLHQHMPNTYLAILGAPPLPLLDAPFFDPCRPLV